MPDRRVGSLLEGPDHEEFRLDHFLGEGSFGKVYKATGLKSLMTVAVKTAPEDKLSDPTTLAFRTMLNEMSADMLKVNYPNVVQILHTNTGTDSNIGPYLIMEYVEGGNLQQVIDQRLAANSPFTLEEAIALMRGIALGAQAINEHLVHRDIKPDNILLDGAVPKIADFGIAKVASESTRTETFKGIQMWWYKAPEGWRQEKNTYKMDVYSAGLVFYQILTLEHPLMQHLSHPFDYDRWREVHLTVPCNDVRDKRAEIPAPLARLMLRMVDKAVGNRPDWNEVMRELSPSNIPSPSSAVDPNALAFMKAQVDEKFRQEQRKSASELKRVQQAEREAATRIEFIESAKRLLQQFDEILMEYEEQATGYHFGIVHKETLSRWYTLMNGLKLSCNVFSARSTDGVCGSILGAAYLGVDGGLSTNFALFGNPDDIASARWNTVRVTLSGIVTDRARWYREAGVSRETMAFLEFDYGVEPWRRDFASYFGFGSEDAFYQAYSRSRAMGAYNFEVTPIDPVGAFNEILICGIRIPSRP